MEPALVANLPSRDTLSPRLSSEFGYSDAECKVVQELWDYLGIWDLVEALRNPGSMDPVGLDSNANTRWPSPADWLETRMTQRMSLSPSDRDMVL
ncbi:MAG: hypothetical protein ACKO9W_11215, partial [Bacteroidota bacterium]